MAQLHTIRKRGAILRKVDDFPVGVTDDGLEGFTIEGEKYVRIRKGGKFKSEEAGIYANGSDMTAKLQAVVNHSKAKVVELDVDGGGDIVINGTLTIPSNKVVKIQNGTKLTGTGTISGGIFRIAPQSHAFATTLNFSGVRFDSDKISVKWFGAVGNNSANDQPAIQKAIDVSIYNQVAPRTVSFPIGAYKIDAPLILAYKNSATTYTSFTCNLVGEEGGAFTGAAYNVRILPSYGDTFAIGYQHARSSVVRGISIEGKFAPTFAGGLGEQFATKMEDFVGKSAFVCRDNPLSPYSGIVIDPFTNNGTSLGANEYPGLASWYTHATGGNPSAGSSGVRVEDCRIRGFVVGHIVSPNGTNRNGENMSVDTVSVDYCKIGFVATNDQQKTNRYKNIICWGATHTLFQNIGYGAGTPGQFHVDNVNIAGSVNRIWNINGGGYYGSFFTNIYAESLYSLGYLTGSVLSVVSDSHFQFEVTENVANMPSQNTFGFFKGVTFNDCTFRKYDGESTDLIYMNVGADVTFNNCGGEQLFFLDVDYSSTPALPAVYVNNKKSNAVQIGSSSVKNISLPFGDLDVVDNLGSGAMFSYRRAGNPVVYLTLGNVAFTKTGTSGSFTATQQFQQLTVGAQLFVYASNTVGISHFETLNIGAQPNQLMYGLAPIGQVKTVNTTSGAVTVDNVAITTPSGTYTIIAAYPLRMGVPFIADVTNASTSALNVEGFNNNFPAVGDIVTGNFTAGWARVATVNAGAKSLTFDRSYLGLTTVGQDFVNGNPDIVYNLSGNALASNVLYLKRGKLKQTATTTNFVSGNSEIVRSGFFNAAGTSKIHEVGAMLLTYNPDNLNLELYTNNTLTSKKSFAVEGSVISTSNLPITVGSDMTAAINTALAISNLKTLVFDLPGGGDITVNGSVTVPAGKILKFAQGTKLIGTGTITNAKIDAGIYQVFAPTLNIVDADPLNGFFAPEWFGAVGSGSADDTASMQACVTAAIRNTGGVIHLMPNKNYKITSVAIENYKEGQMPIFTINGFNAKVTVDGANIGFVKNVTVQSPSADQEVNSRIHFNNIRFVGSGVAGCGAIRISPTYGSMFSLCNFINFDTAVDLRFCLNAIFLSCFFQNSISYDAIIADGDWTGATGNNSQSNQTKMINCRHYCKNGQLAAVKILKTSGVVLDDCIYEGGNPVRNIEFNSVGSTTVQHFNIIRPHVENAPTSESILLNTSALVLVEQYWSQLAHTAIRTEGSVGPKLIIRDMKYFNGDNVKFAFATTAGGTVLFDKMEFEQLGDPTTFWTRKCIVDANHALPFYRYYNTIANQFNSVSVLDTFTTKRLTVSGDIATFQNNAYFQALTYLQGNTYLSTAKFLFFGNDAGAGAQAIGGAGTYVRWFTPSRYVQRVWNDGTMTLGWDGTASADVDMGGARTPFIPPKLAADPTTSTEGMVYHNTVSKKLKHFDGTAWVELGTGATGGAVEPSVRLISGNGNFLVTDDTLLVNTSEGNAAITIDNLTSKRVRYIKKVSTDANTVTITPALGTIDGAANYVLDAANEVLAFQIFESNYYILNK